MKYSCFEASFNSYKYICNGYHTALNKYDFSFEKILPKKRLENNQKKLSSINLSCRESLKLSRNL